MVGEGAALLVSRALTAAGLDPDLDAALPRFLELYDERLVEHTRPYAGTPEMLDTLAARGPLAILTNKPQHHTDRLLDALALSAFFQWVIGGDTPFGRKPDPAGLRELMSRASAGASETVLVGDSAIDLRTAHVAGVRLCLVRYGFGFSTVEGLLEPGDCVVDAPAGLTQLC